MSGPDSSPASIRPVPGAVIAGKYRIVRLIGYGAMGMVAEASHMELDVRVALKLLPAHMAKDPELSERLRREARAALQIKSEHTARVMDVGRLDDGTLFIVMELLAGADLARQLKSTGPLPIRDAVDYVIQACDAVAEAHAHGIVHRDLKPANLFLSARPDNTPLVKVLDFGLAKSLSPQVPSLTQTGAILGSGFYMAPEQIRSPRSVDHRADIYSLGISLYQLIAGRRPFEADDWLVLYRMLEAGNSTPLRELRPDVPDALAQVIAKAHAYEPSHRYESIGAFVRALVPFAPQRSWLTADRIARLPGPQASTPGLAEAPPSMRGTPLAQQQAPLARMGAPHALAAAPAGARAGGEAHRAGVVSAPDLSPVSMPPAAGIPIPPVRLAMAASAMVILGGALAFMLLHGGRTTPNEAAGAAGNAAGQADTSARAPRPSALQGSAGGEPPQRDGAPTATETAPSSQAPGSAPEPSPSPATITMGGAGADKLPGGAARKAGEPVRKPRDWGY